MSGIGPILPLSRNNHHGYYSLTNSYKEQVEQNFKNLMLTSPGERTMNPDFGVGIRHFLFEMKGVSIPKIKQRVMRQIQKYMPYIKINRMLFDSGRGDDAFIEESHILSIKIEYEIPEFNISTELIIFTEEIN